MAAGIDCKNVRRRITATVTPLGARRALASGMLSVNACVDGAGALAVVPISHTGVAIGSQLEAVKRLL